MRDRNLGGSIRRWLGTGGKPADRKRARRPRLEGLEARQLLVASLNPIPNLSVAADLGRVVPLEGGTSPQQFTATSDNPNIGVSVITGSFLSIDVTHASSGPGDPAFSGTMTFQLFNELTPITVRRILALVNQGFYTSPTTNPDPTFVNLPTKNFHRIAPGFPGSEFIVQGGSPNGNGTGEINQPGYPFQDEFVASLVFNGQGQLAMANAGDDTNNSQFFITTGSPRFLDFNHTIFGQLVEGYEILEQMTQVSRDALDAPISPILISGTRVSQANPNGTLLINTTAATPGDLATISVTATDPGDGTTDVETFQVSVVPNAENQRPFLRPVGDQVTRPDQPSVFQLQAVSTNPGDQLTFAVGGGVTPQGNFAPVENATATVDANGLVTVVPDPGFEGVINLVVGVRDQVDRAGSLDLVANFDTERITLTVTTNNRPTATPVSVETTQNEAITIQLAGQANNPGQTLFFELTGPPVNGQVTQFNAETGTLVYTPFTNFIGADSFGFRVRDVGDPTPNLASEPAEVSIQVREGQVIGIPPTAQPQQLTTPANEPIAIQLVGLPGSPDAGQTLTYAIDTTQTAGTISGFDANTGLLVYTPPAGFIGDDSFSFRVTQFGEPGTGLQSNPATVSLTVTGAVDTGAVRQIGTVLVVTPPPGRLVNPDPNTIEVTVVNGRIAVSVNGQIDNLRPLATEVERLVVYGTKASDTITIAPDVPLIATLDGGLGGRNTIQAGDLPSRLHGWFGHNTLRGGAARDELIGRMGRVRFLPSPGDDLLFAGDPNLFPRVGRKPQGEGIPPTGQFFRFVNDRLVPVPTPPPLAQGRFVLHPARPRVHFPQDQLPVRQPTPPPAAPDPVGPPPAAVAAQQRRAEQLQELRDRQNQGG